MQATAKILKYKSNRTSKKLLLVGNGASSHCFAIELNKIFRAEDARQIIEQINKGRF